MSGPDDMSEQLQKVWQQDRGGAAEQEISLMIRLVREKQRSFQDLARAENRTVYVVALSFAPLTGLGAWKGHPWIPFGLGYLIMTVALIAGAAVTWVAHRSMVRPIDLSVHDYHRQLLRWYDQRIRLTTTSSYWFSIPLFLGASVVLYPATHYLPGYWGLALLALLFVSLSGSGIGASLHAAADLRQRKSEVQGLLEEMDRS